MEAGIGRLQCYLVLNLSVIVLVRTAYFSFLGVSFGLINSEIFVRTYFICALLIW